MTTTFRVLLAFDILMAAWCLASTITVGGPLYPFCFGVNVASAIVMWFLQADSHRMDVEDQRLDAEWRAQVERWTK